jgi:hypothetical protein
MIETAQICLAIVIIGLYAANGNTSNSDGGGMRG